MTGYDDHGRYEEDLAAYALGALEPHELAEMEGHLASCPRCRAELARLMPAVEDLGASVPRLEPPPALRQRIMDEVEEGAVPRRSTRRRPFLRPLPVAAALAAAAIVAFVVGFAVHDGGGPTTTVRAQALGGSPVRATLVEHDDAWRLDVDELPDAPAGHVYEVWIQRGSRVSPSSLFVLSRDGRARVPLAEELHDGDRVMVTVEPEGGSVRPTSDPLLQADV